MNSLFLNSEYKQFDGKKEYYNFSCNLGMLRTPALNRQKNCNLRLKISYLNISFTVLY